MEEKEPTEDDGGRNLAEEELTEDEAARGDRRRPREATEKEAAVAWRRRRRWWPGGADCLYLTRSFSSSFLTIIMLGSFRSPTQPSKKQQEEKQGREWFGVSFKPENFIPGQFISFILGLFLDLSSKPTKTSTTNKKSTTNLLLGNHQSHTLSSPNTDHQELKMSAVPFETMGAMWTTKIVVTCKNQQAMNRLKEAAESIGLQLLLLLMQDAHRLQTNQNSPMSWFDSLLNSSCCHIHGLEFFRLKRVRIITTPLLSNPQSLHLILKKRSPMSTKVKKVNGEQLPISPSIVVTADLSFCSYSCLDCPPTLIRIQSSNWNYSCWSVSQLGSLQSLLPLHTAVSSARLTSCLGVDSKGSRSLSQGMLCSANPGV
ncbi:hypothetical protein TEA_007431 [Camellia sinensis var. sinensis]|uniref:Uncharacterized protein n=1 Tax=Camellia sinensis var. sinensis TaxID=542762 RepID=A0A4S4EBU1_CAMSN|nr:hypothetical protein TEA_007431 [Camellia sinensis var. sinensis]